MHRVFLIGGGNSSGTRRFEIAVLTLRAILQSKAYSWKNIYLTYSYFKGLRLEFNTGFLRLKPNNKKLNWKRMQRELPKIGCFKERLMKCHAPYRRKRDKNWWPWSHRGFSHHQILLRPEILQALTVEITKTLAFYANRIYKAAVLPKGSRKVHKSCNIEQ
jgi:hypothetical protein